MFDAINEISFTEETGAQKQVSNQTRMSATIVIPCYNEAKRLDVSRFVEFLTANRDIEFLFVNDGSSDSTLDVLARLYLLKPSQVEILDLKKNGGKAEAVRQGMLHAGTRGAPFVGYWDADLATPLDAIEDFLRVAKKIETVEVIFGSRTAMLGHKIKRKFSRRIVSRLCATLARFAIKLPITDTQCGAKLFKNSQHLANVLSQKFTAGWLFDVELFARLTKEMTNIENKFYEYPLLEWNEIPGSKVDAKAIINSGLVMLKIISATRLKLGTVYP